MLKLSLPKLEIWNDKTESFEEIGGANVELEHSLYTVSTWESKWKKPFSKKDSFGRKEFIDYIANHMCQTPGIPANVWLSLDGKAIKQIQDYIEDPMTATTINRAHQIGKAHRKETVTAELIYFYMFQFGIPIECEHWHLNKLMTLIDVCSVKSSPPRKMGKRDALSQQAALNKARRAKSGSRG